MIKLKKIISALIKEQIDIKDYFLTESDIAKIVDGYLYAIIFMEEDKMIQDAGLEVPEDDYSRFSVDDFDSDTVIDQYNDIYYNLKKNNENKMNFFIFTYIYNI